MEPALKQGYGISLSFVEVFTELALRFGDTAKIQSSYQEFVPRMAYTWRLFQKGVPFVSLQCHNFQSKNEFFRHNFVINKKVF